MSEKRILERKVSQKISVSQVAKSRVKKSSPTETQKNIPGKKTIEKPIRNEINRYQKEIKETHRNYSNTIAELKKAGNSQKVRIENLEAVLECAGGPVFSVDRRYCYTSFNHQHAEVMKMLFGADIQIGCNLLRLPH